MDKTITKFQYLQLLGLFTLAKNHYRFLEEITETVAEITKTQNDHDSGYPYYGHVSDAIWSGDDMGLDEMLRKLAISVKDE